MSELTERPTDRPLADLQRRTRSLRALSEKHGANWELDDDGEVYYYNVTFDSEALQQFVNDVRQQESSYWKGRMGDAEEQDW